MTDIVCGLWTGRSRARLTSKIHHESLTMSVPRAFLLWSAIIPFAIINGFFRDAVLVRMAGPVAARTCSGILLSLAIFGWTLLTIRWIKRPRFLGYLAVGLLWLTLTIAFEFFFGRFVAKQSWEHLLRPYRFEGGDIWPIVLLVVATSPSVAAKLRRLDR